MSDENVSLHVEDGGELDAYMARLDEALSKKERLTGQRPETAEGAYIIPASEMANVEAARENVDEVVAEGKEKLAGLEADAEAAKKKVEDTADTYLHLGGDEGIPGLERSAARITRMLPGLSEAYRLYRSMWWISEGSVFGGLTLALLALSIYKKVAGMLEEQKRELEEYRRIVMEARGFTLINEFERWNADQTRIMDGYRTRRFP